MSIQTQAERLPSPTREITLPWWRQLRWSLILTLVLVAVLPMSVVTFITLNRMSTQARQQVVNQLDSISELKTAEINSWLSNNLTALRLVKSDESRRSRFVSLAASTNTSDATQGTAMEIILAANEKTAVNSILGEAAKDYPSFKEVFFYNTSGVIVSSSDPNQVGKVVIRQPYYTPSLTSEYTQPPYYEVGQGQLSILVSVPVADASNQTVGVLVARLDETTLTEIMTERTGLGKTGETYLVSSQNNYLLTPPRIQDYALNRAYHSLAIDRALAGQTGSASYTDYAGTSDFGVYRWLPNLQAGMLAEVGQSEALGTFNNVRDITLVLTILSALAAIGIGLYAARRVSMPLTSLAQSATYLAGGDLTQRAPVGRRNELGLLAQAFNNMAVQLQELVGSLEARVQARTKDLQLAAQVSEQMASILDVEQLLPQVVELTRANFDLYHAHIYLLDETNENLMLAAGSGEAGRVMKAGKHSIPARADRSLVARAARDNTPVIVDDVTGEPGFLPNPLLPSTRSEAAFPLAVGDRVLGVLDVQSEEVARFDADLLAVLSTLAGQVAVALDNARLFSEVERTSRHERMLGAITQQMQQATSIDDVLQTAVRELGKALGVPRTAIELRLPTAAPQPEEAVSQGKHGETDFVTVKNS